MLREDCFQKLCNECVGLHDICTMGLEGRVPFCQKRMDLTLTFLKDQVCVCVCVCVCVGGRQGEADMF